MYLEVAEVPTHGHVLGPGDVLIVEEQDLVVHERLVQLGEGGVVEVLGQVQAGISAPMWGVSGRTSIMSPSLPELVQAMPVSPVLDAPGVRVRRYSSSSSGLFAACPLESTSGRFAR